MVEKNKSEINIGVDIEEIDRFRILDREKADRLFKKIYTSEELEYCLTRKKPAKHLAVRFAAKEAIIKAFGSIGKKIFFNQIEILHNKNNAPFVNTQVHKDYEVKISMAHTKDYAVAYALIYERGSTSDM